MNRVCVLGIGNIGKLYAHALAVLSHPPPLTLLLHRSSLACDWLSAGKTIDIVTNGVSDKRGNFDVELVGVEDLARKEETLSSRGTIHNLLVTTKTTQTVSALTAIKSRLSEHSTILFSQNGMGTIDEINDRVFPDPARRPQYLASVNSHGVFSTGPFSAVHAGMGTISLSKVDEDDFSSSLPDAETIPYMIDLLCQSSFLGSKHVSSNELRNTQFEKLVVNAMINPLTVIFDCRNGDLFTNRRIASLMGALLHEVGQVIFNLPEMSSDANVKSRFTFNRLQSIVFDVAEKTGQNYSSMLQDVRAGKPTEIDYINGYFVRRGLASGIACPCNERLIQMVRDGKKILAEDIVVLFGDVLT